MNLEGQNTPNLPVSNPITSTRSFITCCVGAQSRYIDYRKPRRFWQFVYDRLIQAAEWVYDNKL